MDKKKKFELFLKNNFKYKVNFDTTLKKIEWDSLTTLTFVVWCEENNLLNKKINYEKINNCIKISDIFDLINSK